MRRAPRLPTSGVITLEIPSRYRPAVAKLLPRGNSWSLTGLSGSSGAQPSRGAAGLPANRPPSGAR